MRFLVSVLITLFLLTGCGSYPQSADITNSELGNERPRIPQLKASVLEADTTNFEVEDMKKLLEEIDRELERPNIAEEDIKRGWYYGSNEDKKYGTPDSWIWIPGGDESKWASPNILEEEDIYVLRDLCIQTAGTYIISCLDTEVLNCEYTAKSKCHCIEESKWNEEQGCILTDEEDEYIEISLDDLRRGYYEGLPNEKMLNTPSSWIWVDAGRDSRWQNPSPK